MTLFDFLFNKKTSHNPTDQWVRDPTRRPTFNLNKHSLDGVTLGQSYESLNYLGPATLKDEELEFPNSKLTLGFKHDLLTDFTLFFPTSPQNISFTLANKNLDLDQISTEQGLRSVVGEPFWREADDDEVLLFYEFGSVEWQIECLPQGQIQRWLIVTPPLLADSQQRQAYGITKDWPYS